ncbi:MAG: hypothetical protein JSS66_09550 [Armatimonadetes bacterium]|nr:hypothetical protein [Armatimonadota bacterium]
MIPHAALLLSTLLPVSGSFDIVPGSRIGHVRLGFDNPSILGQPTSSDGAAGHIWSTWKGTTGNTLDTYAVIGGSEGHEVQLARITSSAFHTANGVKTGQTWGSIKQRYSGVFLATYASHQFSRTLAVVDNKAKGITFEFTVNASNHVTNASRCKAIWIHAKGMSWSPNSWTIYEPTRP